jgi:DNA repair exonuclease SbcCD nuclease subunit
MVKKYGMERCQVIFLGDINDKKQLINNLIQNEQISLFEQISKIVDVHIIIGNHDSPFTDKEIDGDKINSCRSLSLINGVNVYTKPTILKTINDESCLMMPYVDKLDDELEIIRGNKCEYLFAHTSIAGFHYEGVPVDESKHLKIDDLSGFKQVFLGHIHKRQQKNNILYVGTPYHTKSSEWKNLPGIQVMNFENGKTVHVENDVSPRYVRINLLDLLDMKVSDANNFVNNNFVNIIIPSILNDFIDFMSITDHLDGYRLIEYKSNSDVKLSDIGSNVDENGIDISEYKLDLESKFIEYIDSMESVKVGKNFVSISNKNDLKSKLKSSVNKLYKSSLQNFINE